MLDLTDWQNKKYTTRDGRPVRLLCVDAHLRNGESIIGISTNADGTESANTWHQGGNYWTGSLDASPHDLINAKTKKEGWVSVESIADSRIVARTSHVYATQEEAICARERGIPIKIEWEE